MKVDLGLGNKGWQLLTLPSTHDSSTSFRRFMNHSSYKILKRANYESLFQQHPSKILKWAVQNLFLFLMAKTVDPVKWFLLTALQICFHEGNCEQDYTMHSYTFYLPYHFTILLHEYSVSIIKALKL